MVEWTALLLELLFKFLHALGSHRFRGRAKGIQSQLLHLIHKPRALRLSKRNVLHSKYGIIKL